MRRILYILAVLLFQSCGYRFTEDDKHPQLPIFPKHTNSAMHIEAFPFFSCTNLRSTDSLFFFQASLDTTQSKQRILVMNNQLHELARIPIQGNYTIDSHGNIYMGDYDDNDTLGVLRYEFPDYHAKRIPRSPTNYYALQQTLGRQIDSIVQLDTSNQDNWRQYVNAQYINLLKTKILPQLQCILHVGEHDEVILRYPDQEVTISYFEFEYEKVTFQECPLSDTIPEVHNQSLQLFDSARLENRSTGNHFVFGFYQSGYQYFHFQVGTQITSFKSYSYDMDWQGLRQMKSPDPKQILLLSNTGPQNFFHIRLP